MQAIGVWSPADITFASPLRNHISGGADTPKAQGQAYVIYDKKLLFQNGYASNGICAFLAPPSRACIGFMSDKGYMALPQVNHGTKPEEPAA
jgi:hypothetical protein